MADILFVEYLFPGIVFGGTSVKRIADETKILRPREAVGWRTFRRTATTVDDEELLGQPRDYSSWTYVGRAMTVEDVRREQPEARILISNMEINGYARVVMLEGGQAYPLNVSDRVVEAAPAGVVEEPNGRS